MNCKATRLGSGSISCALARLAEHLPVDELARGHDLLQVLLQQRLGQPVVDGLLRTEAVEAVVVGQAQQQLLPLRCARSGMWATAGGGWVYGLCDPKSINLEASVVGPKS